eukprot:gnl/TRDRNA2_/TRDRNA2_35648_c0_seq1.p1 gnl/TRDRNA2_/TRDRNA2_35648_c0~~gnl/TRDRNA2_/TRDRNA2_35648_c0_seq1.p1  ORF type:complete len:208 (-),score=31.72 gnl/TRDRNA2_/TRDRNA2_35648_c0_seq1:131-727(-)
MAAAILLALLFAVVLPTGLDAQGFTMSPCGVSKRPIVEDPVRRFCLRQCQLVDEVVIPSFNEFEGLCRDTASADDWDADCQGFICCMFGCAIFGGDRRPCLEATGRDRFAIITEVQLSMQAEGMSQELRCDQEKCRAYCAREAFDTCREVQFQQKCTGSQLHLYGCDVDCGGAASLRPTAAAAAAALAVLWLTFAAPS